MRIIGGSLKGKIISPPRGFTARPTTDFAKEGLFNTIINQLDMEDISVLDLFSGTGSITYEFASRGCRDIVAVEMNPLHANFIKSSIKKLDIQGVHIVRHNVFDFIDICTKQFDLIFADPPYDISNLEGIPDKILSNKQILRSGGLLILEHPAEHNFTEHQAFLKEKKYGNVHFSFFSV